MRRSEGGVMRAGDWFACVGCVLLAVVLTLARLVVPVAAAVYLWARVAEVIR